MFYAVLKDGVGMGCMQVVHATSKIVHFLLREATGVGIYKVLVELTVGVV